MHNAGLYMNYGGRCHVGSSHGTSAKGIGTNACLGRLAEQRLLLNCSAVLAESSNFGELPRAREKRWGLDSFCYRLVRERATTVQRRAGQFTRGDDCYGPGLDFCAEIQSRPITVISPCELACTPLYSCSSFTYESIAKGIKSPSLFASTG